MPIVFDETAADLAEIVSRDFGSEGDSDPNVRFLDWVHYRARRIPCRPRHVALSQKTQEKLATYPAIARIRSALLAGEDVSPWLSRRTTSHVRDPRADMMFNDWQITHFHLGRLFSKPTLIRGTSDLLYAHVTAEHVTCLDVLPHNNWVCQNLLHILLETRPKALERMEIKGVLGPSRSYTDAELLTLRTKGVSIFVSIQDRTFIPGLGVASSGHATRLVMFCNEVFRTIARLKKDLPHNRIAPQIAKKLAATVGVPVRLGVSFDPAGTVLVYDKMRQLPFFRTRVIE